MEREYVNITLRQTLGTLQGNSTGPTTTEVSNDIFERHGKARYDNLKVVQCRQYYDRK
jgi:hypothetical protein